MMVKLTLFSNKKIHRSTALNQCSSKLYWKQERNS